MRNGRITKIKSEDVVLDDICYFYTGKQICADSIVRKGNVEVNESMLTGESELVVKKVGSTLYAGSFVVSGECYAKVDKVGSDNFIEQISSKVKHYSKPKSEIMNSLKVLIRIISATVIVMAVAVFYFNYDAAKMLYPDDLKKAYDAAVVATGGSVIGMIPSGLFLMTSISLAAGVLKLAKHRTVVQDMYCIEMLSRVDVMCLDKTGTITDGTMKVKEVNELNDMKGTVRQIISTMSGILKESSPTSVALQKRFGVNKKAHYRYTIPFSSARKYSAVYFDDHELSYLLGAPEFILKERYTELEYDVYRYSKMGYRVLLLASSPTKCKDHDTEFQDIVPLALIAIEDTIRKDAVETINYFKNSGVAVKVISGDNPVTVSKIARRAGVEDAEKYISLEDRGEDDLEDLVREYTVFGRVSPNQKQLIIQILKEQGHTVAMTGDGVNDILALKEADCSIAMANGADAARSASHLVLLDSNFSSMPKVVMEGRRVVNNIKRVSTMYLTKTIFSFLLSLVFIVMNSFKPTTYPIEPIYLLPFDWFIVTIPSFYLALEKNNKRISGKFLSDILLNALPGAILIVVNYLIISISGSTLLDLSEAAITCVTVYSIIIVGVLVLFSIFKPFNLKRAVVFTLDIILLLVLIFVSPYVKLENGMLVSQYFGLIDLDISAIMLLIIIAQFSMIILHFSGKLFTNIKNVMKTFNNESE
jgi:cation-transporting ATPase E